MHLTDTWILLPARGGSKGIPRKNLRLLHGTPLLLHILSELSPHLPLERIIVSTDDNEIAFIAKNYAQIHLRDSSLSTDSITLDEVAVNVAQWLIGKGANEYDILLTVQPTSPFIRYETVIKAVKMLRDGAKSIVTVKDDRHLRWTIDEDQQPQPLFQGRLNRQLLPITLAETGGIIGAHIGDILRKSTRIHEPVALLPLDNVEGLDIDTYADWAVAEYYLRRKRIVIRADASVDFGMGHVYRAIALAQELSEHDLIIVTKEEDEYKLGANFLQQYPYHITLIDQENSFIKFLAEFQPDITIIDVLDTTKAYIKQVLAHSQFLVTLEDMGAGASLANLVINDLYTDFSPEPNHWYGIQHSILAPQFEFIQPKKHVNDEVANILITFGGTDPSNLTIKVLQALEKIEYNGRVVVVLGYGYQHDVAAINKIELDLEIKRVVDNMAELMSDADLALTSAGRTVTELVTVGIPTIVMCQNLRELLHTHASGPYGVVNLGLGKAVTTSTLNQHIKLLLENKRLREEMHRRALRAARGRSNRRIVKDILNAFLDHTDSKEKQNEE